MPNRHRRLLVLGNSVTALAVVRDGRRLGLDVVLADREPGVAFFSRCARSVTLDDATDDAVAAHLALLAREKTDSTLIATSDEWLRFLRAHREPLDAAFTRVLHPCNAVLDRCLDKLAFADVCRQREIPTPAACDASDLSGLRRLRMPWIVRPAETRHGSPIVPKAVEVRTDAQLAGALAPFRDAGVPAVVSESLLGGPLAQFSVAYARTDDGQCHTYVTEKVRPAPERCTVGAYVRSTSQPAVEALGRRAVDALDLRGVGEVEILRDETSGQAYVIEINPRPWAQFSLAGTIGCDFLGWLLGIAGPPERPRSAGWVDHANDLYFALSRSEGALSGGWLDFVGSFVNASAYATFDPTDTQPFLADMMRLVRGRLPDLPTSLAVAG